MKKQQKEDILKKVKNSKNPNRKINMEVFLNVGGVHVSMTYDFNKEPNGPEITHTILKLINKEFEKRKDYVRAEAIQ